MTEILIELYINLGKNHSLHCVFSFLNMVPITYQENDGYRIESILHKFSQCIANITTKNKDIGKTCGNKCEAC